MGGELTILLLSVQQLLDHCATARSRRSYIIKYTGLWWVATVYCGRLRPWMLALMLFNFQALSPDWSVHLSSLGLQERLMATCLMYSLCRKYDLKVLRWSAPIRKVSRNNMLITLLLYPRILTEWAVPCSFCLIRQEMEWPNVYQYWVWFPCTVEPRPVDTPLLWTPHHCGHFLPSLFSFPY